MTRTETILSLLGLGAGAALLLALAVRRPRPRIALGDVETEWLARKGGFSTTCRDAYEAGYERGIYDPETLEPLIEEELDEAVENREERLVNDYADTWEPSDDEIDEYRSMGHSDALARLDRDAPKGRRDADDLYERAVALLTKAAQMQKRGWCLASGRLGLMAEEAFLSAEALRKAHEAGGDPLGLSGVDPEGLGDDLNDHLLEFEKTCVYEHAAPQGGCR